jgi:hypothetical protein
MRQRSVFAVLTMLAACTGSGSDRSAAPRSEW